MWAVSIRSAMKLYLRGTEVDLPPPSRDHSSRGIDPELIRLVSDPASGVRMELGFGEVVTDGPDGEVGIELVPEQIWVDDSPGSLPETDASKCVCGHARVNHALKPGWVIRCEECGEACQVF